MAVFKQGTKIPMTGGDHCVVKSKLGEGGQGAVYRVEYRGEEYALKWYKAESIRNPVQFYHNLENNIKKPINSKAFLWPLYLTEPFENSFGYIMRLFPHEYEGFSRYLTGKVHFANLSAVLTSAINVVSAFTELHAIGYSYQDLNDGNFFINPKNGSVLVCDNDNVSENGENITGVAGKMRYMAPEIVTGKEKPSLSTDRFSLAVVLFMILCMDHPLDGKRAMVPCLTPEVEKVLYGIDPVFIFDPKDDRNRPVRGVQSNAIRFWPVYPDYIRNEFTKAFSKGVMVDPKNNPRTTDRQWLNLLLRARTEIVKCRCGSEYFMNLSTAAIKCGCGFTIKRPVIMHTGKYDVVLAVNTRIYPYQVDPVSNDYTTPIGIVLADKKNVSRLGLGNNSGRTWKYVLPDGTQKDIYPKGVAPIVAGAKINMGTTLVDFI